MKFKMCDYTLDFVIPQGLTGESGKMEPSINLKFLDTSNTGSIPIKNSESFPINNSTFTVQNDQILYNESGQFEYNISGIIKDPSASSEANLILRTRNNSGISNNFFVFYLNQGESEVYFSQTKIGAYSSSQYVNLLFQKDASANASIENVELTIKKIYKWE